jgi:hypothetical protein
MATDIRTLELEVPLLRNGDRLSREEFERRWDAMPEVKKAELIDGVVYMPPILTMDHGEPHFSLITWLGIYQIITPGVGGADNASILFDDENVPQPDALLRILETHGGQSRISSKRVLEGGPEVVAEIANTTVSFDLGIKKEIYNRFNVQEYIVWRVPDQSVDWFVLRNNKYVSLNPGADGVIRSEVFPGLWLDPKALIYGDSGKLLEVSRQGHDSQEHREFIAELKRRAESK